MGTCSSSFFCEQSCTYAICRSCEEAAEGCYFSVEALYIFECLLCSTILRMCSFGVSVEALQSLFSLLQVFSDRWLLGCIANNALYSASLFVVLNPKRRVYVYSLPSGSIDMVSLPNYPNLASIPRLQLPKLASFSSRGLRSGNL
ncbi:hypothetical protein Tco_0761235 [Tanacetum coccineum]